MSSFNEEYYKSIGGVLESNDYTEQSNLFKVSWALHEGYKDVSEKLDDLNARFGAFMFYLTTDSNGNRLITAEEAILSDFDSGQYVEIADRVMQDVA